MVNYGGLKCVVQSLSIPERTGSLESWRISQLFGFRTHGTSTIFDPKNYAGEIMNIAYNVLVNKIYISQTEFAYDLITEEISETIEIWNADQIAHTLYSVNIAGATSGIVFEISAPKNFAAETINYFTLKILVDGPALQDNTITLIFDTITITLNIYGVRVKTFPFDCHFNSLKISYVIKSAIFENEHFSEQRRALHTKVMREQDVTFLFNELYGKRFLNSSRSLINKVLGIGIYSEPINQIQEDLYGLANFSVEENLSEYWNLSNSIYIVLIDLENNISELKELLSYSSSSITLKYSVSGHFYKDSTIIYPAFFGIISEKPTIEAVTNSVISTAFKFREISL